MGMSTRQIAAELGLSRSMIERIQNRALKKVRAEFAKRGIKYEDLSFEPTTETPLARAVRMAEKIEGNAKED